MRARDFARLFDRYPSVVLSYRDASGYPCSLRCAVRFEPHVDAFDLGLVEPLEVERAPASLLGHAHDAKLWNQTSVLVRGYVETRPGRGPHGRRHVFVPLARVGGIEQSATAFVAFVIGSRYRAARYLRKRGLSRPAIPWDRIAAVRTRSTIR